MPRSVASLLARHLAGVRAWPSILRDRHGAVSTRYVDELWASDAVPLSTWLQVLHPRMGSATVDTLVQHAFADLEAELRRSWWARACHSRTRAERWLLRRLLQYAQAAASGADGDAGALLTRDLADLRPFAEAIDRLPIPDRYCIKWPLPSLRPRDVAAALGLRLREFDRACERALAMLDDPRCDIDAAGLVRYVNEAAVRVLGAPTKALLGRPVHDILHAGTAVDERLCPIHRALATGHDHHVSRDDFQTASGTRRVEYLCRPRFTRRTHVRRWWRRDGPATHCDADEDAGEMAAPQVRGAVITFQVCDDDR